MSVGRSYYNTLIVRWLFCAGPTKMESFGSAAELYPTLADSDFWCRLISADRDLDGHMFGHERSGSGKGKHQRLITFSSLN